MLMEGRPIYRAERGPFGSVCGYDSKNELIGCQGKKEMGLIVDAFVKGGSKKAKPAKAESVKKAAKKPAKKTKSSEAAPAQAPTKAGALKAMTALKSFKPSQVLAFANAATGQAELWVSAKGFADLPSFATKTKFSLSCQDDWGDAMFAAVSLKGQVINGAIYVTDDQAGNDKALSTVGSGNYAACSITNV